MEVFMKRTFIAGLLALSVCVISRAFAQDSPKALPDDPSSPVQPQTRSAGSGPLLADPPAENVSGAFRRSQSANPSFTVKDRFQDYVTETFLNPAALTAPAFRAGIRMANPPTRGAYTYPDEWRQGAAGFGRNYGDAVAERVTTHTARLLTGIITHEDPRYVPSSSHNVLARSFHAIGFTFVDRSDAGHPMPAISNLAGAAAGGAVGMAYLPPGFDNLSYAGRRAAIDFGALGGANVFREFAPQLPGPIREFIMLIGR
jgi:hypothetical protein